MIELNAKGELVPSLAESWTPSEDGTQLTFKLREGVKFHNGEEMTAEDVAYTYNQAIATPATSSVTSMMKEMTVDDTYTCTLTLTEPFGAIESCIAASTSASLTRLRTRLTPTVTAVHPSAPARISLSAGTSATSSFWKPTKSTGKALPLSRT
ncbi:MAG: ABC transporter substrate-binding protein [Oscillospiraceae bacterium]